MVVLPVAVGVPKREGAGRGDVGQLAVEGRGLSPRYFQTVVDAIAVGVGVVRVAAVQLFGVIGQTVLVVVDPRFVDVSVADHAALGSIQAVLDLHASNSRSWSVSVVLSNRFQSSYPRCGVDAGNVFA